MLTPRPRTLRRRADRQHGLSAQEAATAIETGLPLDAAPARLPNNPDPPAFPPAGLNAPNPATFYSPGTEGYTDYPFMQESSGSALKPGGGLPYLQVRAASGPSAPCPTRRSPHVLSIPFPRDAGGA